MGNIGSICFLPVCSECKKVIEQPVCVTEIRRFPLRSINYEIDPEVCPNCGAKFISITTTVLDKRLLEL